MISAFEFIITLLAKLVGPVLIFFAGKREAQHEATKEENKALAESIAVSDRVDNLADLDSLRDKLNHRP